MENVMPNIRYFRSEDPVEDQLSLLLPKLPDEITMSQIVPKLPWKSFHRLAAVNRAWRKAILHRHVYNARFHSCSPDTLVVHGHVHAVVEEGGRIDISKIAVHSFRDRKCFELPPIPGQSPGQSTGVLLSCQCVSLDGKMYVLGGNTSDCSNKVYVMDLAWAGSWKECASMEQGRKDFGCAVVEGKIYVLGGLDINDEPVGGAEVYDPKVNAWSPIMPMITLRYHHKVSVMEKKIVVHGGHYFPPLHFNAWKAMGRPSWGAKHRSSLFQNKLDLVEVYDTVEDEWTVDSRSDDPFFEHDRIFMAHGKFFAITYDNEIVAHQDGGSQWNHKTMYFPHPPDTVEDARFIAAVVSNGDEILAGVERPILPDPPNARTTIFQSKGFGTETSRIPWKDVSRCAGTFDFMHSIIRL